ncbi:hypothetical protein HS088_TW07G01275 [Tripterygium wilfordii]|uniref:LRR receptor-like serine/threonine-protein kinase n=1 Tax=Tripterygium wilfordii TaxID=458696 RepID=A0A7J7DH94_TRIWF|nr:hypothetical protein HS088_TW07G01275 [Tripterygium wilfordii]
MDLSNNMFIGEIPVAFVDLKNFTLLNLFRNKLGAKELIERLQRLQNAAKEEANNG